MCFIAGVTLARVVHEGALFDRHQKRSHTIEFLQNSAANHLNRNWRLLCASGRKNAAAGKMAPNTAPLKGDKQTPLQLLSLSEKLLLVDVCV